MAGPAGVTGCVGWWDDSIGASITLDGSDRVTAQTDQSGTGNDLSSVAGPKQGLPQGVVNGIQCPVYHDGTNVYAALGIGGSFDVPAPCSLFFVVQCNEEIAGFQHYAMSGDLPTFYLNGNSWGWNVSGDDAGATDITFGEPHVVVITLDTTSALYVDNVHLSDVTGDGSGGLVDGLHLGDYIFASDREWHGPVCEKAVFDHALDSTERTDLYDYAVAKWIGEPEPTPALWMPRLITRRWRR